MATALFGAAFLLLGIAPSQAHPETVFDADGTVHVDGLTVPPSAFESDEAKESFAKAHSSTLSKPADSALKTLRAFYGLYNDRLAARMKQLYPVDIKFQTIAGVRAEVISPREGVARENLHRVLINLHGGGFMWGEGSGGEVESIPIASIGKMTVITLAYRLAPENKFPAASIDVAAVYRALLTKYRPREIGIYGCSAGGILTAEATAWIVTHGMPAPGAIGTFCGSAAPFTGDTVYVNQALNDDYAFPPNGKLGPYFADANPLDPMVYPINSNSVLAKFPPTLLLAGSRDFSLSSLFATQRRLTTLGVDAELHVWDGLPHAFFMDPDLSESREVYDVVAKFFARHLTR